MHLRLIFSFFLLSFVEFSAANDVLGCGGFIKSHVHIDFSKVVIKLFTKHGILKDQTNCAPSGYYFIPLYDNGDYLLQLEPPAGWSFTPTKFNLVIDGKTDICSQGNDINFVFKGFGITGKVETLGSIGDGPSGVHVELKSEKGSRSTITGSNGIFSFTPVYPGNYNVTISHDKWRLIKDTISLIVTEGNTEIAPNSLLIGGYDVSGSIKSDGESIQGAGIILYSMDKVQVDGCNKAPIAGYNSNEQHQPLCHVMSDEHGNFIFPSLPNGNYYVIPFYKDHKIHFVPNQIKFVVLHDSVTLQENFEIVGFSIPGRVLNGKAGEALAGAEVHVNNENPLFTKADGSYLLAKVKAATYSIQVRANHYRFEAVALKVNPSLMQLPDLYPSAYQVCGTVISDKSESATISITKVGSTFHLTIASDALTGKFCEFLAPGKYQMLINLEKSDESQGLQFFPISQVVEVVSKPIFDVTFTQLKATINGKIECLNSKDCESIKVVLKPIADNNDMVYGRADSDTVEAEHIDGTYTFNDVRPGKYQVSLTKNVLCWIENDYAVTVTSAVLAVPKFVQTGYSVVFDASHDTIVQFKQNAHAPNQTSNKLAESKIALQAGVSTHCVPLAGEYTFTMDSCHTYATNSIEYKTSAKNEILVTALKHRTTIQISAAQDYGKLSVGVNSNGVKTISPPIAFKHNKYQLDLYLSEGENVVIIPQSDLLFFNPPLLSINGARDCADLGIKIAALKGKLFQGAIVPPLEGVQITIESDADADIIATSDSEGRYKFPPLDDSKVYRIKASKESYVMVGPGEDGHFKAYKLAEVVVEVFDESDNAPLQGVLLSLSGGQSYRSNMPTNENGKIVFKSLSPGEYFLRPMMKEYHFNPASKIINVEVGVSVKVKLQGKRVAFSAFGQVTSLNKHPEERMIVEALGVGNCSQYSEEATSEANGQFRIRGLLPYCMYDVTVKRSFNENETIERSAPQSVRIPFITKDLAALKIIVFRANPNADVMVNIYTENPEHYKSLRVKISDSTTLLHTIKIDTLNYKITKDYNHGILVQIPSIPLDGKQYSIQLESTSAQLNKGKPKLKFFTADSSFKFVKVDFVAKSNVTGEQIKQTSIWTLATIFVIMLGAYNVDQILQLLKLNLPKINFDSFKPKTTPVVYQQPDNNDIDQIIESINAVKRKVKPKRI